MAISSSLQVLVDSIAAKKKKKKRYGIPQFKITGEKLSAASEKVVKFRVKFQKLPKKTFEDQQFNHDESGLHFCMLPPKTLAAKGEESASVCKKSK